MVPKSCFNGASATKARCMKWQRTIIEPRWTVMYHALSIFCFKNYTLMLKKCWLCNNNELTSVNVNLRRNFLVHVYPYSFCLFRSVKFHCRGKWDKNLLVKSRPKWRLSTIPHFVDNDFISSYRHFMPKLWTCCNTNWLHSNRAEKQDSIYAFRGTAALKEALDQFLLKGDHRYRARGQISLKSGQILSVIFLFYRRFSFILSKQSHSSL